jgi:hypothetical protein
MAVADGLLIGRMERQAPRRQEMLTKLIVESSEQGCRFNERESVAAFACVRKIAVFARVMMSAVHRLPAGSGGRVRVLRA